VTPIPNCVTDWAIRFYPNGYWIVNAVVAMVELDKVPIAMLVDWLLQIDCPASRDLASHFRRINYKHFVRSLWIRLNAKELLPSDIDFAAIERKFNPYCR